MEATIEDNKTFTKLISTIAAFDTSFILKCSKDGMRIFCMDPSKSSIIQVDLPPNYFSTYMFTCKTDNMDLGINVPVFMDTLKGIKKTDTLRLKSDEGKDLIHVQVDGEESQMVYDLKLMTIHEEALDIPEMEYNLKMRLNSAMLKTWKTNICDHTGESLAFHVEKDKLMLSSAGTNVCVKSTVCQGESMSIRRFDKPCDLSLSKRSITTASRICDIASTIEYGWTNNAPANFSCTVGNDGKVSMWFAPEMVDPDEDASMTDA